jgi:single-strand DNA-binding protein
MIALEGSLRTGKYQDKNHSDVTHYTTDVFVDNVEFVGGKNDSGQAQTQTQNPAQTAQSMVAQAASAGINVGTVEEFEEILSDSDVPF